MYHQLKFFILSCCLTNILTGCYPTNTTVSYSDNLLSGSAKSDGIMVRFADDKHAPFKFFLEKELSISSAILTVIWRNPKPYNIFTEESTLKFMVDREHIITLLPIKTPRRHAYLLDSGLTEEEATYRITHEELQLLANAKRIDVELTGKNIIVAGYLGRYNGLLALKNFVNAI